ncbi:glucosamine-6-phosphate deaminase [Synechococcus sp. HK05]|uniref:glucosamine-6-phosphate deaminase n=1 Tax=Synechococcus sp. HK05 TaxID=2725975 RepID=UPI0026E08F4F|nr:glucosamine-6-phosphate deaminase [Synechococcus sp. HK05]
MITAPLLPSPPLPGHLLVAADAAAAAAVVAERLEQALQRGAVLGLATGRTMEPVYAALRGRLLALAPAERAPLLARWRSFNLDEYVGLAADHPGSFAAFMRQQLADPLALAPRCLQLPDGVAADPDQEARRYAAALQAAGGIDLQLLGLGSNGHVGFNEPPCGPEAPCRCLELSTATRRQNAAAFGGDPAAVPAWAITLGTAEILAARVLLLVVTGEAKAEILRRTLLEPPCPEVPASWLQRHPRLQVVVDRAAAAALPPG